MGARAVALAGEVARNPMAKSSSANVDAVEPPAAGDRQAPPNRSVKSRVKALVATSAAPLQLLKWKKGGDVDIGSM